MPISQDTRDNTRVTHERYRLCGQCGNFSDVSEGHTFCILCGAKLMEECPRCKEPIIYPTARFCPACGERLVSEENSTREIA